jgi:GTP-binding protein
MVGRSNVGKSSLINALSGHVGLAKVSAEPGRTHTINVFQIEPTYYLVDLPGYGFARKSAATRETFEGLITSYLREVKQIALALLVIDCRQGLTESDQKMLYFLKVVRVPVAIIVNKTDKLSRSALMTLMKSIQDANPSIPCFPHSTKDAESRAGIKHAIAETIRDKR